MAMCDVLCVFEVFVCVIYVLVWFVRESLCGVV